MCSFRVTSSNTCSHRYVSYARAGAGYMSCKHVLTLLCMRVQCERLPFFFLLRAAFLGVSLYPGVAEVRYLLVWGSTWQQQMAAQDVGFIKSLLWVWCQEAIWLRSHLADKEALTAGNEMPHTISPWFFVPSLIQSSVSCIPRPPH